MPRSKPVEEFEGQDFDFVITLCDYARESCPVWPGQPILARWSSPAPDLFEGDVSMRQHAFRKVSQQIYRRLELLASLPFDKFDTLRVEIAIREIGERAKITIQPPQTTI